MLLELMKKQIERYQILEYVLQEEIDSFSKSSSFDVLSKILMACNVAFFLLNHSIINVIAVTFLGSSLLDKKYILNNASRILDDYKKNKLFLEHQDEINSFLSRMYGEEVEMTINDIDYLDYEYVEDLIYKSQGIAVIVEEDNTRRYILE